MARDSDVRNSRESRLPVHQHKAGAVLHFRIQTTELNVSRSSFCSVSAIR